MLAGSSSTRLLPFESKSAWGTHQAKLESFYTVLCSACDAGLPRSVDLLWHEVSGWPCVLAWQLEQQPLVCLWPRKSALLRMSAWKRLHAEQLSILQLSLEVCPTNARVQGKSTPRKPTKYWSRACMHMHFKESSAAGQRLCNNKFVLHRQQLSSRFRTQLCRQK